MNLISFLFGGLVMLILVGFIAFFDVHIFNDKFIGGMYKIKKLTKRDKFKIYLFYSCWEGIFFLAGIIVGNTL